MNGQPHDRLDTIGLLLEQADQRLVRGESAAGQVWPTGFPLLDTYLGGGLRSGELTLLGGGQGTGKTTLALQVARRAAAAGLTTVYFSFEHPPATVLGRLIALEAAEQAGVDAVPLRRVREALEATDGEPGRRGEQGDLRQRLGATVGGVEALQALRGYGSRLVVHRATGEATSVSAVRHVVEQLRAGGGSPPLVVVDYLQKLDGPGGEGERIRAAAEGLKDLSLAQEVPVLAVVAADLDGVAGRRVRVHQLRGSSVLAYEADVVLILNEKYDVVARHHLMYDVAGAERYHEWVVLSIEKNRGGLAGIDLQLRKRFDQARFEPDVSVVEEALVDDRVHVE